MSEPTRIPVRGTRPYDVVVGHGLLGELGAMVGKAQRVAVIHPAADGGYALLGLSRFDRSLFEGIVWSTPSVAADTLERLLRLGWTVHVAEVLHDVDEPADLERIGHRP